MSIRIGDVPAADRPDGYQGVPYNDEVNVSNAYITFTDKLDDAQLELAFKWADFMFSDDASIRQMWGVQGVEWDYADPDNPGENMFGERLSSSC